MYQRKGYHPLYHDYIGILQHLDLAMYHRRGCTALHKGCVDILFDLDPTMYIRPPVWIHGKVWTLPYINVAPVQWIRRVALTDCRVQNLHYPLYQHTPS